jgi:hypothetical protein
MDKAYLASFGYQGHLRTLMQAALIRVSWCDEGRQLAADHPVGLLRQPHCVIRVIKLRDHCQLHNWTRSPPLARDRVALVSRQRRSVNFTLQHIKSCGGNYGKKVHYWTMA